MSRGLAVLFLAILGCGGAQRPSVPRSTYPVLARVPARTPYVLAAARLAGASQLLRDLARLVVPFDLALVDTQLRGKLGVSPIDPAGLAEAGFDPEGSVALYGSRDGGPTVLLPVAHPPRVDELLGKLEGESRDHRGHVVHRSPLEDGWSLSTVTVAPWLVLHVSKQPGDAWLDELLDDRDRFTAEIEHSDGIFAVDVAGLDAALAPDAPAECAPLRKAFASRWRRVLGQARFAPGELHASVIVELPGDARRRLEPHVLALDPVAAASALRATWRIDLAWLAARDDTGPDASRCQGLLGLGPALDPAVLSALLPGIRAFDVTVAAAEQRGDQLDLDAEAALIVSPDAIPALTAKLARAVDQGLTRPAEWVATDRTLRIATARKPGPAASESAPFLPIAALHYTGGKIPDLVPLARFAQLVLLGAATLPGPLVELFGRIESLDATASLGEVGLTLSLDLVLRP